MAKKFPSDQQDQYMVRFPNGMRDFLKLEADRNGRSMNAEIIHRLELSMSQPHNTSSLDHVANELMKKLIHGPYKPGQMDGFNELYGRLKKAEADAVAELVEYTHRTIEQKVAGHVPGTLPLEKGGYVDDE